MVYLFIHQSFPGQYVHVIRRLLEQADNTVHFISQPSDVAIDGVQLHLYTPDKNAQVSCHPLTVDLDNAIRNGASVAEICRRLHHEQGFYPDLVVGHGGWGETLFVKDVFPDAAVLTYFEFYYHASGADVGFDPEFGSVFSDPARLRTRNAINLMAFDATDWGHAPTQWQRGLMPPELRQRITVLHEGVDTHRVCPLPGATLLLADAGVELRQGEEVITYVSRNLEPYRGFHIFARALPEILRRRPNARVVIVGEDGAGYGPQAPPGTSFRQMLLAEIGEAADHSRVHLIPKLAYDDYVRLLQVSAAHVYLTVPFVLSWSFVEAMAAGCLVIGSATPPVLEILEDGVNGLAVDFFEPGQIVDRVCEVLDHPDRMQSLRDAARQTALASFDLHRVQLPLWMSLFDDLLAGRRPELDPQPL